MPAYSVKLELLRRAPLFEGFAEHELAEIAARAEEIEVPAGAVLVREGDPGDELFVIVSGSIRVESNGAVLTTLWPGDFMGEIALIDGGPRTATAICDQPARLIVLRRDAFQDALDRHPSVQFQVLNALTERVRRGEPRRR